MPTIEVSVGELVDKVTILQIKMERVTCPDKRRCVNLEYQTLKPVMVLSGIHQGHELYQELLAVNGKLWDIENGKRACEAVKEFGGKFVDLARAVYQKNDRRADIKRKINEETDSRLVEVKEHPTYK